MFKTYAFIEHSFGCTFVCCRHGFITISQLLGLIYVITNYIEDEPRWKRYEVKRLSAIGIVQMHLDNLLL